MPRPSISPETRKHLIILVIAILLAIGYLLIRAETATAATGGSLLQITGEDYQRWVTLERLLILGMLGLVVLTWFYLKWRPPPDYEDEQRAQSEPD